MLPGPRRTPEVGRPGVVAHTLQKSTEVARLSGLTCRRPHCEQTALLLGKPIVSDSQSNAFFFFSITSLSFQNKMPNLKAASGVFYLPGDQGAAWVPAVSLQALCLWLPGHLRGLPWDACSHRAVDPAFVHTEHSHLMSLEAQGHSYWFRICIPSLFVFCLFVCGFVCVCVFSEIHLF